MKYTTIIETDDYKDFEFFEDGNGKYMCGIDAGAVNHDNEWIALYFTECKQEPKTGHWIPCSERQPKENGNYLAFYRTSDGTADLEFMMVDHFNAGCGWLHEENGGKAYKKVIAWMPLPEPYRADIEKREGENL